MASSSRTLVVFLVVAVAVVALGAMAPAAAASQLYGVWSPTQSSSVVAALDPLTGKQGAPLYTSDTWSVVVPVTPAIDQKGQRLFVPLYAPSTQDSVLAVFDLSTVASGQITLVKTYILPMLTYFFGIEYDPVLDQVWLVVVDWIDTGTIVELVDLTSGNVTLISTFPVGSDPAALGLGGSPVGYDIKNKQLILPTMTGSFPLTFAWTTYDITSNKYSNVSLGTTAPVAMSWGDDANTFYTIYTSMPENAPPSPLSFGTIDARSGKLNTLAAWNSQDYVYNTGALAAYDSSSGLFYSVLTGSGPTLPVSLVSVKVSSGQLAHVTRLTTQPTGLFFY